MTVFTIQLTYLIRMIHPMDLETTPGGSCSKHSIPQPIYNRGP